MSVESTTAINQQIRDYVENNPKSLFDATTSYRLLSAARTHIFGESPSEQVNAISLMSSLTDRAPKFQQIGAIYDEALFDTLFNLIPLNIKPSTFASILRISAVYLSGRLTSHRTPILLSVERKPDIIRLISEHLAADPINVIASFTKLLNCVAELQHPYAMVIMNELRKCGFFTSVTDIAEDHTISLELRSFIAKLKGSVIKISEYLRRSAIQPESSIYQSFVDDLMELYKYNLSQNGSLSTTLDYVRAGLTEDPQNFIITNYNSANLLSIIAFLKTSNLTFKKEYCEQLIFADHDSVFPLSAIAVEVSNFVFGDMLKGNNFSNLKETVYAVDSLFCNLMIIILRVWKHSKATQDDIPVVMNHLHGILRYADSLLSLRENGEYLHSIKEISAILLHLSYNEMKKLQIEECKRKEEKNWELKGLDKFNHYLKSEVLEFVKEQRLLKLSKGSWVYSEDPIECSARGRKPQMYFMILSPNNSAIIYKEFKTRSKTTPNIDKTGHYLNLNSIATFETTNSDAQINAEDSSLISLKTRSSFKKISLKSKTKKVLLSFYTDTHEASYIWSDGLKLVSNAKVDDLSEETNFQIDTLVDVRKSGQLADLAEDDAKYTAKQDYDVYNTAVLDSLVGNFYYE